MMLNNVMLTSSRLVSQISPIARRAVHIDQMEFDSALSQMYLLLIRPSVVSKMSKARKTIKNHYYRDDPAFIVLQLMFSIITSIAFGLAFQAGVKTVLAHCFIWSIINYFIVATVVTTSLWLILNKYFMNSLYFNEVRRDVDWLYVFDVHCNAYFVYFTWTSVIWYILLPFALEPAYFTSLMLSNCICTIGLIIYTYNVFLGFLDLPVLMHQQKLLYPIPFIVVIMILLTILYRANVLCLTLILT